MNDDEFYSELEFIASMAVGEPLSYPLHTALDKIISLADYWCSDQIKNKSQPVSAENSLKLYTTLLILSTQYLKKEKYSAESIAKFKHKVIPKLNALEPYFINNSSHETLLHLKQNISFLGSKYSDTIIKEYCNNAARRISKRLRNFEGIRGLIETIFVVDPKKIYHYASGV